MHEVTIDDNHIIPFGKYKGEKTMAEIPASYHLYMYKMDIYFGGYKDWVKKNKQALEERAKMEEQK